MSLVPPSPPLSPPPPGLGTLTAIQQYGELSRASHTHSWSSEGVPVEMPLPPMGEEDMEEGIARKAEWIMELVRTNQLAFSVAVSVILLSGHISSHSPLAECLLQSSAAHCTGGSG